MLGPIAQLEWDRSRARALAWLLPGLLLPSLLLAGCGNELEVTTEYIGQEAPESLPPGTVIAPALPDSLAEQGRESEPAADAQEAPVPPEAAGNEATGEATPGSEGAQGPIALAPAQQVPSSEHCAAVADWDPLWVQFEEEVLLLLNEARSQPADCGEEGVFAAAGPLVMDATLRCSARLHSLDMFERRFFNHVNPDGKDPFQRMGAAGFRGGGAAENIAVGQTSPAQVMQSWMDSDSHCSNVMRRSYTMLGVGYHPGAGKRGLSSNFWTQNFGAPPRSCSRNCR